MERLRVTFSHLSGVDTPGDAPNLVTTAAAAKRFPDSADDVVIVSARRTPIAKGNRGSFKVKSSGNLAGLSVNGHYKLMFTYYTFTFYIPVCTVIYCVCKPGYEFQNAMYIG